MLNDDEILLVEGEDMVCCAYLCGTPGVWCDCLHSLPPGPRRAEAVVLPTRRSVATGLVQRWQRDGALTLVAGGEAGNLLEVPPPVKEFRRLREQPDHHSNGSRLWGIHPGGLSDPRLRSHS